MRLEFATRRRPSSGNAVRITENQNQTVPRRPVLSTRSPTMDAARSGVVKRAKIDSARDVLRMSVQVPTPEQCDSGQIEERIYRAPVQPFYFFYRHRDQNQSSENRPDKVRGQRFLAQKTHRFVAHCHGPQVIIGNLDYMAHGPQQRRPGVEPDEHGQE